jgi:nucleotide-binding universal stress UspA family protein
MNHPRKTAPVKIHVAVDGSEHAFAAAQFIHDLALPSGSEVTALGVLTPRQTPRMHLLLAALDEVTKVIARSGVKVETGVLHGAPAVALRDFEAVHPPDLLIIGAKGLRATFGVLLGGDAQQLIEHARKPVLVVRTPYTRPERVLFAADGSKSSEHALRILKRFPFLAGNEVHVIHVLPPVDEDELRLPARRSMLESAAAAAPVVAEPAQQTEIEVRNGQALIEHTVASLKAAGINAVGSIACGDAAEEILRYANENAIDMIVAGGRGLGAVRGWFLGSVSRKLVHYAQCDVLIEKGT